LFTNIFTYFVTNQKGSVERIPPPPTVTFDLDLPKFKHLVPCGQGYDWQFGDNRTCIAVRKLFTHIHTHIPISTNIQTPAKT